MLTVDEIEANARTYQQQAFKVLDDDPTRLELRHNSQPIDPAPWLTTRAEKVNG